MPHKRNPVKCEQLTGLSRLMRGYAMTSLENQALWHERDISHSSAERVILPDSTTLLHYMLRSLEEIISGLYVYPDAMRANLSRTRGLIFSQRILLELVNAGMSREDAYAAVQSAAMRTWEEPATTFRDELLRNAQVSKLISPAKFDALMDYSAFLIHIEAIFSRALRADNGLHATAHLDP
jgi:adenylosuccinate lyase